MPGRVWTPVERCIVARGNGPSGNSWGGWYRLVRERDENGVGRPDLGRLPPRAPVVSMLCACLPRLPLPPPPAGRDPNRLPPPNASTPTSRRRCWSAVTKGDAPHRGRSRGGGRRLPDARARGAAPPRSGRADQALPQEGRTRPRRLRPGDRRRRRNPPARRGVRRPQGRPGVSEADRPARGAARRAERPRPGRGPGRGVGRRPLLPRRDRAQRRRIRSSPASTTSSATGS